MFIWSHKEHQENTKGHKENAADTRSKTHLLQNYSFSLCVFLVFLVAKFPTQFVSALKVTPANRMRSRKIGELNSRREIKSDTVSAPIQIEARFIKAGNGPWHSETLTERGGVAALATINCELEPHEIYRRVRFDAS